MKSYVFVLGRNNDLSLLELISYFQKNNINYKIEDRERNLLLISLDKTPSIKELAGTIKIAEIIGNLDNLDLKNKLSYYTNSKRIKNELNCIFKRERIKAIFKQNLDSTRKLDLEILTINNKISLVTQTSSPKEYRLRDEKRPCFDNKKVISIRLAKILINLSQAKTQILDPFCGCGTILQEALLNNLDSIGVDKNIKEAETNIKWLCKNFKIKNNCKLIEGNSMFLSDYIQKAECAVTEPYLGPYFKTYPSIQEAKKTISELEELYSKTIRELSRIIEKKIVIIVPIIKTKHKLARFDFLSIIHKNSLKICRFKEIKLPILYRTRNNTIIREIWILEKLK